MKYPNITSATFISRTNRFIARVLHNGEELLVHVKNTGRCKELFCPGVKVYLTHSDNPTRKTAYDLVAVEKERAGQPPLLINIDSGMPNEAVAEWLPHSGLFSDKARITREHTVGASRFDFYIEDGDRRCYIEVKGATLEECGVVLFPDAPTLRGVKHLNELSHLVSLGHDAYVIFVVAMSGAEYFTPNDITHPEFGEALRRSAISGVKPLAYECIVTPDSLEIAREIKIKL